MSYDVIYMWKKMIQMNLYIKQKQTQDTENKFMVNKVEGQKDKLRVGIEICTLLYIKQTTIRTQHVAQGTILNNL